MDKKTCNIKLNTNCTSNNSIQISSNELKQSIVASNNKAFDYAEQAKIYRNEAKEYRDSAKNWSEQNSNVTLDYVNEIKNTLDNKINNKQDLGDYVQHSDLPQNVSELTNDIGYALSSETANIHLNNLSSSGKNKLNSSKMYLTGNIISDDPEGLELLNLMLNNAIKTGTDKITSSIQIPYTLTKTGSKIVSATYRNQVQAMYDEFGYAPYFTLGENDYTLPMGEIYGMTLSKNGGTLTNTLNISGMNGDTCQLRLINNEYGVMARNDGTSFYLLLTNKGDPNGTWNSLRPIQIGLSDGKVSLNGSNGVYLKTCYVSGASGYNIWSNGYCEQWGHIGASASIVTITFLKEFSNTNYNILNTFIDASTADSFGAKQIAILSKTVSNFKVERGYTNRGSSDWRACGYLASGQY